MGTYVKKIVNKKDGIMIFYQSDQQFDRLEFIVPNQLSFFVGTNKKVNKEQINFLYETTEEYNVVNIYSSNNNKRIEYICSYLPYYKDNYKYFGLFKSMNCFVQELQTIFFLDKIDIEKNLIDTILIKLRLLKNDKDNMIILNFEDDELMQYNECIEKLINLHGSNFKIILSTEKCLNSIPDIRHIKLEDI